MRYFLLHIVFIILLLNPVFSQQPKGNQQSIQNQLQLVRHDTCLDKKFSVVIYLIQDSINSLTSSPLTQSAYSLTLMLSKLNEAFRPICVSFEHCKTIIIPNWTFNNWKHYTNGVDVLREYYVENTICIFIPESLVVSGPFPDDPELAYTFNADTIPSLRNSIVIQKFMNTGSTLMHVFGLFFGLPHTFAEITPTQNTVPPTPLGVTSKEFVDKSNCQTHGDGFCDTEADPYPAASNIPFASDANCAPLGLKDGKLKFYNPPSDNYMSHYSTCRCIYSNEQYYFMVHYIMKKRLYLH